MSEKTSSVSTNLDRTTRRDAARMLGGASALVAATIAGLGGTVVASEATPIAQATLVGKYAVVRVRKVKPDYSAEELARTVGEGFVPIVREVPGFVSYFVVADEEQGAWASVGVFEDKAGADESTRRAAAFGQQGTTNWVEGDPIIIGGTLDTAAP